MKQDNKLLTALSGYLPYGVRLKPFEFKNYYPVLKGILGDELFLDFEYVMSPLTKNASTYNINSVKPYLRKMSSMTDSEREEYETLLMSGAEWDVVRWLNEHMFDYLGLIDEGLAVEALGWMYKKFEIGDEVIIYCFDKSVIRVTITEIQWFNEQIIGVDSDGVTHWGNFRNVVGVEK